MDFLWIFCGFSMDFLWFSVVFYGFSVINSAESLFSSVGTSPSKLSDENRST